MRTVRFLTAASLLAALLIAGLTWAWWPRPVKTISFNCEQSYSHFQLNPVAAFGETDQLEIAMGGSSGTHWLLRGDRNFGPRLRPENEHATMMPGQEPTNTPSASDHSTSLTQRAESLIGYFASLLWT